MVKQSFIVLALLSVVALSLHATTKPVQGPPGPAGPQGIQGRPGQDGQDHDASANHAMLGADVLWFESKDHVGLKSGYRFDTIHKGHTFDMAVIQWRMGKSPEDREIDRLRVKLKELEHRLQDTSIPPVAEKPGKRIVINGTR